METHPSRAGRGLPIGALLLVLGLMPGSVPRCETPGALPIDPSWSGSALWDDGLAEVATYQAHRRVYSDDRAYETTHITVKEEFDRAKSVKADPPYQGRDLWTVLKLNIISRIETGNYPYDYMTSVFVRRDDPRLLVKLSGSSQEWCGTTFKEVVTWDGPPRIDFHSYFDGQADGSIQLDFGGGALLEEQLFLVMRGAAMKPGVDYPVPVYDSLITNAARPPVRRRMIARVSGEETVGTPAGAFATRRIELLDAAAVSASEPSMLFWIEKSGGHALVKFTSSDGRALLLTSLSRRDYWTHR